MFEDADRVTAISASIMGDEHTDVFYFCPACRQYTVAEWWDNFTGGEETCNVTGPFSKEAGDERVALIRKCAEPWDKKCRCAAHREYFNNTLD